MLYHVPRQVHDHRRMVQLEVQMPRKVRELEADLARAGFTRKPAKGSHRKWSHPKYKGTVTVSGQPGADAKSYQEDEVAEAIAAVKGAK